MGALNTKAVEILLVTPLSSRICSCSLSARTTLREISVAGVDDGPEVGVEGGQGQGDEHLGGNSVMS